MLAAEAVQAPRVALEFRQQEMAGMVQLLLLRVLQ
jgi:hypothetical protein